MHAPAARALSSLALAARVSRCAQRSLHTSPSWLNGSGSGPSPGGLSSSSNNNSGSNDGKPAEDSLAEHDASVESQTGTEITGGRSRTLSTSSLRNREARKRPASALPAVHLPATFLENNVSLFTRGMQPRLPVALAADATHSKTSGLYANLGTVSDEVASVYETYFETARQMLQMRYYALVGDIFRATTSVDSDITQSPVELMESVLRTMDMMIDSAWHLTDALYPARNPEYVYNVRPFWWWHWHKGIDVTTAKFHDQHRHLQLWIDDHIKNAERLDYPLSHAIPDIPLETFDSMQRSLDYELHATAPANFDSKTNKRPINVLSMSGYGGKSVSEAMGEYLAFWNDADLVRVDAYDLSILVGEYLGQNWAYSRGALSMMGFRAAELNGRLDSEPDLPPRTPEADETDTDSNMIGFRTVSGSMEDELQKIKQGGYECFSKWENLKIDKILSHIIGAPSVKSGTSRSRPLLIHVHDLVELSMTLEGSQLINKLRTLVDSAWQRGTKIAILGTSSCEQPSDEYQNAARDLVAGDLVITRHIEPGRADKVSNPLGNRTGFSLKTADAIAENTHNINRMMRAIGSGSPHSAVKLLTREWVNEYLKSLDPADPIASLMGDSILPIPEVYHLATSMMVLDGETGTHGGLRAFEGRFATALLKQRPGQTHLREDTPDGKSSAGQTSKNEGETKSEDTTRLKLKVNEYEKRITTGIINKDNLRTTFADVHAPTETISALKTLTSLALVRPDAFSYGVLKADKIPGCLLYGPPGTGKTMLAKAVAKESGANMLEVSGAMINDKWVGESEKLIRAVFTMAKKLEPCVIFIDEADSMLASRSLFASRGSHREHINQFLKEWDGMEETNAFIMVATNRPYDLDDAILRRLPRKILVDLPLRDDRAAILRLLLKGEATDESVSLDDYADRTPFYSGSDLKNLCVAAAMAAVEEEEQDASAFQGAGKYKYPEKRLLKKDHFESAMKQIPASISEDMVSLKAIRKFDEDYGNRKKGIKKSMGFGILDDRRVVDTGAARIRTGSP